MNVVQQAQEFLQRHGPDAWLVYDYQRVNPVFSQTVGEVSMVTRPAFLLIPPEGRPQLLAHHVDLGRFDHVDAEVIPFSSRAEMLARLTALLASCRSVAMEYSPQGALPRASRVDAGTVEMVRGLGVEVVSSADLFQYATQRWGPERLASHQRAAQALGTIVLEAFNHIGTALAAGVTEYETAEFIRRRIAEEGLFTDEGPVVAANAHASDPHFEPRPEAAATFQAGDWVLIDLWAREPAHQGAYADITWVGYIGEQVPSEHQRVFQTVIGARDAAVEALERAWREEQTLQGWEVDRVARDFIAKAGYGQFFTHRLGHSLGETVHADAVNLDDHETHDTRALIPGIGFTIEPGIYLPDFGVRSEIDLFMGESGPIVTSPVQREVVLISG